MMRGLLEGSSQFFFFFLLRFGFFSFRPLQFVSLRFVPQSTSGTGTQDFDPKAVRRSLLVLLRINSKYEIMKFVVSCFANTGGGGGGGWRGEEGEGSL